MTKTDQLPGGADTAPPGGEVCDHCHGTGYVHVEESGIERAVRCSCRRRRPEGDRLSALHIPPRFRECALEESPLGMAFHTNREYPTLEMAKGIANSFIQNFPDVRQGLLFMGQCGVGKTHLAVAILKDLAIRKGVNGRFCDFHELLRQIRESYNPVSGTSEMAILQPICNAPLLVLDDLGAEKPSPWVQDTLHFVINQRYLLNLPTLITTNYLDDPSKAVSKDSRKSDSLTERIGDRLRSRLFEMCRKVFMDGRDYRREIDRSHCS